MRADALPRWSSRSPRVALRLLQARWAGYVFGLAAVVIMTAILWAIARGRLANASALYTIPVLVTAALYGRTPALITSLAAFLAFAWFFSTPPLLDPTHLPTLAVLLLISLVAGQLATSLHQQVQAARQREREALALYEMARLVHGSTLELHRVLGLILDQLHPAVGYDSAALLLEDDSGATRVVEYRGPLPREHVVGHQPKPGSPARQLQEIIVGRCEPVIEDGVSRAAWSFDGDSLHAEADGRCTVLGVPLIVKGHVIGMLVLLRSDNHSYRPRQAEVAMIFAQQAAVAIENARLYEVSRDKAALEERQRLARELHDSVSQQLYGIALNASTAQELFDSAPERARRLVGDVLRLAEAGLAEMRALIFELRPESLELEGLVGALEKQAAAVQARHSLEVRLDLGGEPDLPVRTKEVLYRVAQEALHNATKHAHAHTLDLTLHVAEGEVRLVVADDGRGFDAKQAFPGHLGLTSMRERAAAVGGTLEIDSAPGGGARLCARVPLPS